jgi:hypothetical protein
MTDDSDGGAVAEAITSAQGSTAVASDGVGETVDVLGLHAVIVSTNAPMTNHPRDTNGREPTAIGSRIRK